MRKFKVILQGRNLLLDREYVGKYGVFIIRLVEAVDEVVAPHAAMEDFRCDPKGIALRESLLNSANDPPVFEPDEITELESFGTAVNGGFIFYPEKNENPPAAGS